MPINTLQYAKIFQTELDRAAVRDMTTGWMDPNSSQVRYNGGNEVKIPKISTQGLGEYDRDNGYVTGSVTVAWETHTMTQDRGRKFQLDAMDVDETAFVATASSVLGEFQRIHVVPEIDAYRLSRIAKYAIDAAVTGMVVYSQTVSSASSTLRKIKEGIKAVREQGYSGRLICHANDGVMLEVQMELADRLRNTSWAREGVDTQVPVIDDVPLIATPSNRMYTAITLYDGTTSGQEGGGYAKGSSGKDVNFIIVPENVPIAVTKQDKVRIFSPETYQKADAWALDYRRYHDLWVLDNQVGGIYVSVKDAAS
jgi:hypothetical protein